jgi:hypothetical protein
VSFTERADAFLDRIKPILANASVEMQGAVLADLTAIWIAGHRIEQSRAEGDRFREELLELHAKHVRELALMYLGDADG